MKAKFAAVILIGLSAIVNESYGCTPPPTPPTARLLAIPQKALVDEAVLLDASASTAGTYPPVITEYKWDFDSNGIYDYN